MRLASLSTFVHCKVTHSSAGNTHYLCMCNNIAQVQSANSLFKFEIRWHTSSAAMIYCIAFINDVRYYHGNSTPYVAVCQTARVAQLTQPCQYRQHSLHMVYDCHTHTHTYTYTHATHTHTPHTHTPSPGTTQAPLRYYRAPQ